MKKAVSTIVFLLCAVFIIMGIANIISGDIENYKEGIYMIIFLLFFGTIMVLAKWPAFKKIFTRKF